MADKFDACPQKAGVASLDSALHGCPPPDVDTDKDGIPDGKDACPKEAGIPLEETSPVRGCPQHARYTGNAILLLSSIYFYSSRNTQIQTQSMPVIDDLAVVLNAHPELKLVEIQGHTNEEERLASMGLSQRRADAVRNALVSKGVAASRLVAKGYGLTRPLAMPDTTEGRSRNPRIELVILDRGPVP